MTINQLNNLPSEAAYAELHKCCGAKNWVTRLIAQRPFRDQNDLFVSAEKVWKNLSPADWKEAFSHHPKIGDLGALKKKFASTAAWAAGEQSGVQSASDGVLRQLAEGNRAYEEKFGYIFIVCATGLSADEMLEKLNRRLQNDPSQELLIAAEEQNMITKIRLEKLLRND